MDLSRVRRFEWTSAALGVALLGSMFFNWYRSDGVSGEAADAWHALSVVDLVIALAAVLGISLVIATATQRATAMAQALAAFTTIAAGIASLLVAYRTVSVPGPYGSREVGLWLGLACSLGLTLAAWRSMADERFPESLQTHAEVPLLRAPTHDEVPRAT